ncbi:MAG: NAD(P)H-dependent oxidoreductase [Alphaproteobacteria bacterium]|nr:NAD(P)H-dependent oxidoreductase [Alphaproteobacteria bacterium]MDE2111243.1 NAD(P)H-dependent oxidoreductase [Alphaproteobacteria bacterium]MDE2492581.1 NAD(P)H-dependent oxidoreductase [Alphaproteobacteria bacterium]
MQHALIIAHPNPRSFVSSLALAYGEAAEGLGHKTIMRDLYGMAFDPCLKADEIPTSAGYAPRADVVGERVILRDVDVFALFYPFWLNAPPAMLKGYLDRVFGMGFAYGKGKAGNEPLLRGRKLISFTTSGAPTEWVMKTGAWEAVRTLFDEHVAAVCGMQVADHVHFGGIVPGIRGDVVARHQQMVRDTVARQFGSH